MKPKRYPYSGNKKTNKKLEQKTIYINPSEIANSYYPPLLEFKKFNGEETNLTKETIKRFLEFRKKFTKRQWTDLETAINARFSKKADQLKLDDFDLKVVAERLERYL